VKSAGRYGGFITYLIILKWKKHFFRKELIKMEELFSIIVPVYNGEKTIRTCIESVIRQTYRCWELIIVNDGSNDKTTEICSSFEPDCRIRVITKENGGVSDTRNRGIQAAKGEYILFLDADDSLTPDACAVFSRCMKDSDYCISGFNRLIDEKTEKVELPSEVLQDTYNLSQFGDIFGVLYLGGFTNAPWGKCFRRALINFCFDVDLCLGEDLIFNLQYLEGCRKISVTNTATYNYVVQNSGSLSSGYLKSGLENLETVYEKTNRLLEHIGYLKNKKNVEAVDNKYTTDFLVMLERKSRSREKISIRRTIEKYQMIEIFTKTRVRSYGFKYELQRSLLAEKKFFAYSTVLVVFNLFGKIKKVFKCLKS